LRGKKDESWIKELHHYLANIIPAKAITKFLIDQAYSKLQYRPLNCKSRNNPICFSKWSSIPQEAKQQNWPLLSIGQVSDRVRVKNRPTYPIKFAGSELTKSIYSSFSTC